MLLTVLANGSWAHEPRGMDWIACASAGRVAEQRAAIPSGLLHAIGLVESGRYDPRRRAYGPWPWTIDVGGNGQFFASRRAAIAAVSALRASGVASIDVGCMQVNLQDHPDAFATLDDAFDPAKNTDYAARFLRQLRRETGSWPGAVAAYHSRVAAIALPYARRVMQTWPLSARYVGATFFGAAAPQVARPIDPYRVYTPRFAARLASDAAFLAARDAALQTPRLDRPRISSR